jgi:ATP-binding cassette subfamily B protein
MEMPDGLDTVVGEGGATLSGGEKQRISIARAILKDAPIVLLDEATASIDPDNERYIQQAISDLVAEKTLIVIAHKLTTIKNADQILVIDDGKITQRGVHDELIAKEGLYQKMWDKRTRATVGKWTN